MAATTLQDLYEQHMKRRALALNTIQHYIAILNCLEEWMAQQELGLLDATAEDIEALIDTRRGRNGAPLAKKSRYFWISTCRSFWTWAICWGHTETDPTRRIIAPKLPKRVPRPIANDHLLMAIDAAQDHPTILTWFLLAAYSGLRCAEIGWLNADDIDLANKRLFVTGKGDKQRVVFIHPVVERAILGAGIPPTGAVFRRPRGGRYPAWAVSHVGNSFLRELGLTERMHTLRHWFGTNTYDQCHDLRLTQELMGHADPSTTAGYTWLSQVEGREAIGALPVLA